MQEQFQPQSMDADQWQDKETGGVNIHKIVGAFISNLPWFVGCVVISFIIAFLYLRYTTPIYQVNAQLMIKRDNNADGGMSNEALLQDLGMQVDVKNINNEMTILHSHELMRQVVTDLELNIHYTVPGRVAESELYSRSPFKLILPGEALDSVSHTLVYNLQTNKNGGYKITYQKNTITGNWNDTVLLPKVGRVVLMRTGKPFPHNDEVYTITITKIENAVNHFLHFTSITNPDKVSSIVDLSIQDPLPKRGEDILNYLIKLYQQANIDDKNETANNTMEFIDKRLDIVGRELTGVEKQIAAYKKTNKLIDVSTQSQLLMQTTAQYNQELTDVEVKLNVLNSLADYIKQHKDDSKLIPTSLVTQAGTFSDIIEGYNQLRKRKAQLLMTNTENNPVVKNLDDQLESMNEQVMLSLASLKRDLQAQIQALQKQNGYIGDIVSQIPGKERVYLEYSRQQAIKQEIYLFLLKKREETAIGKSTNIANSRVIEPARTAGQIKPVRDMVFLAALFLGLFLPGLIIYLRNLLNTRIENRDDIIQNSSLSIAGEIGHSDDENSLIVLPGSRSVVAEQFRALRTNIEFLLPASKEGKVIMITSSMSGEGKSFISLNLASTLALSGKKVVLMELDLRKPKISKYLGIDNHVGFSNYAIDQLEYDKLVVPSGAMENFYIIPSGPIPPNPSELITLPIIEELFAKLRKDFDYVVVDTAPIGFVTDAQLLGRYTDASLYLVRQRYTYKQQVQFADELYRKKKMPRMSIVVNDVKVSRGYGYSYGYGYYSYGYGYGYGHDSGYFDKSNGKSKSKKGLKNILNRISKGNKD